MLARQNLALSLGLRRLLVGVVGVVGVMGDSTAAYSRWYAPCSMLDALDASDR